MSNSLITIDNAALPSCKAFALTVDGIRLRDAIDPDTLHATVADYIDSARKSVGEIRATFDALTDEQKADNLALQEVKRRANAADEAIKNSLATAAADLFALTSMDAAETQFAKRKGRTFDPASLRGILSGIVKECDAMIEANTPPMPTHEYCFRIELTDDALKKLVKFAEKNSKRWQYMPLDDDATRGMVEDAFMNPPEPPADPLA